MHQGFSCPFSMRAVTLMIALIPEMTTMMLPDAYK